MSRGGGLLRLSAVIHWLTTGVGVFVALAVPAIYFAVQYQYQLGTMAARAEFDTYLLGQHMSHAPRQWQEHPEALEEIVSRSLTQAEVPEHRAVKDAGGRELASNMHRPRLDWPVIGTDVPLELQGRVVATYHIERSLRPVARETVLFGLLGLAFAAGMWLSWRRLPLQALRRAEHALSTMAHFDTVTSLPNRAHFQRHIREALVRSVDARRLVALFYVDLDHFKKVNDSLGHHVGDELLAQAAGRIQRAVRREDFVARLGGDEFTVVLEGLQRAEDAERVARQLIESLRQPFALEGREVHIGASVGVALYPLHAADAEELARFADMAMYAAKRRGRNGACFFSREMNDELDDRLQMEQRLRVALSAEEFFLHFQPIIDLATNRWVGAEALLRWENPELGAVPPSRFVAVLEDTGLIVPVGDWVLRAACRQARDWAAAGVKDFYVSVNVSARQFREANFVETVRGCIREFSLSPPRLQLEFTESMLIEDSEASAARIAELRALGVRMAVDDFGTGYSSLSYLKRFPVTALKIDRSFVADLRPDAEDCRIVHAIIDLAHNLGLEVTAEGVEQVPQLELLKRLGCDHAQGYYFGRPVSAADLQTLVERAPPSCYAGSAACA